MPEVQNIGTADYAQYQPIQQQQYDDYSEYVNQPQVYDENMAEMREASRSRLGATILTTIIIGGGALLGGYYWGHSRGSKTAEKAKESIEKELNQLKDSEAVKNYDKLKKATEDIENFVNNDDLWRFRIKNRLQKVFGLLKDFGKKQKMKPKILLKKPLKMLKTQVNI